MRDNLNAQGRAMSGKTLLRIAIVIVVVVLAAWIYVMQAGSHGPQQQLNELDANSQKWQDLNITHYRMQVGIGCFCPFSDRMPLTVEVLDGRVVSVQDKSGQTVAHDDPILAPGTLELLTIPGVFTYARDAIHGPGEIKISYDANLGYPVRMNIDPIKNAVDDELSVTIGGLQALP
jgi:hypothetical protein